ncbi:hypothetical protein [Pseudoponticoccus marisrubri]|uniref:Uncharacterized protein n=1 Tax=Pseudoponticoccus marisrubri TaxID=1685382 RepID=A0A0W7WQG1_9RHOB|nr:hypothetical protein [Pseudoponticoccus marisrubri]KUF12809.1 hypothetical protein AVJ23_03625 [Pseudoponticoccus marisrubri]
MTLHVKPRGGAAVGHMADLDGVEAAAVLCLRLWSEAEAHDRARKDPSEARALDLFAQIAQLMVRFGRRPLMRHSVGCVCLGADEACFAQLVGAASEGAREDAMLMATLIVRPDMAPALIALAEEFGLLLRRMTPPAGHGGQDRPNTQRLH